MTDLISFFFSYGLPLCLVSFVGQKVYHNLYNKKSKGGTVVVGLQFGDEGKGKVVQHYIQNQKFDVCARFNGGPNAGHTIYKNGVKIVTHVIPTGIAYGAQCLIGPGCVIDPEKFQEELDYLSQYIDEPEKYIKVAHNAHIITSDALEQDKANDKIGTTLSGIGPTYAAKCLRTEATRVEDMKDQAGMFYGCQIVDSEEYLRDKSVLFEGAQGFSLDIDWGFFYPYVTSSSCLTSQALTTGMPHQLLNEVLGVAKLYETYVGKYKFQPENDQNLINLQKVGNEFGATTNRPRQCNWLNLDRLDKAIRINGVTKLIINKCDIVNQVGIFKLYQNGQVQNFQDLDQMQEYITDYLKKRHSDYLKEIIYSYSPDYI